MHSVSVAIFVAFTSFLCIGLAHGALCPDGYCRHSDVCYLVVGLRVSWIDARSYCTSLGGKLFYPWSEESQSAIEGALRRSKGTIRPGRFWLDINDLLNPKDWKATSSSSTLSYSNWYGGYNGTDGNCVAMNEKHEYGWSIVPCTDKMNFVCYASGEPERKYNRYSRRYEVEDVSGDPVC